MNQGGVLSPLLFRKYLCDLKDHLDKEIGVQIDKKIIAYLLWADDLVLFSNSPNGLQKQLDNLFKFTCKNQLVVNATKTKVMKFGNDTEIDVTFTFNGNKVDRVQEYKYLGIIFSAVKTHSGNLFKSMIKQQRLCTVYFMQLKNLVGYQCALHSHCLTH